jgi:D-alanyl-D-alanine carboxypeptidase/D-alanyl-D-alanine carboxypeptidase (penicillin-binding protein 5/6)
MNSRADQIGMANTHFVTPSGLDNNDHYSSARDLALLMAEALKNESFSSLTAQKTATVDFVEPKDKRTTYSNHNRLLKDYEYCTGGKTGYTTAAGRCLVSSAQKDGVSLICVTLNDKNDWNDHKSLYDYGFDRLFRYESNDSGFCLKIPCVGGNAEAVTVTGEKDFALTPDADKKDCIERKVYIDSFLYATIFSGKKVGRIEYTLNGELLEAVALVAAEDIFTE